MKHKTLYAILYWLGQITWGILTFLLGALATIILKIAGRPSFKNGFGVLTTVGKNWGGLSLGPFAFCGRYNEHEGYFHPVFYEECRRHEFGHSFQVLIFGPLYLFIVGIPSVCRYFYATYTKKKLSDDWYDSVWFEGTATRWGTDTLNKIEDIEQ